MSYEIIFKKIYGDAEIVCTCFFCQVIVKRAPIESISSLIPFCPNGSIVTFDKISDVANAVAEINSHYQSLSLQDLCFEAISNTCIDLTPEKANRLGLPEHIKNDLIQFNQYPEKENYIYSNLTQLIVLLRHHLGCTVQYICHD